MSANRLSKEFEDIALLQNASLSYREQPRRCYLAVRTSVEKDCCLVELASGVY
jgi:hypothetical protein